MRPLLLEGQDIIFQCDNGMLVLWGINGSYFDCSYYLRKSAMSIFRFKLGLWSRLMIGVSVNRCGHFECSLYAESHNES